MLATGSKKKIIDCLNKIDNHLKPIVMGLVHDK